MKWYFTFLLVVGLCCQTTFSQVFDDKGENKINRLVKDWSYAIDTTWGAGLPTVQKQALFNAFWTKVDQTWGGFPNLIVDWDSIYDHYDSIVTAGVSRGRFYGILSKMKLALNESHVWIKDFGIDSTMGFYTITGSEYPNYFSFHYLPEIPLLNLFSTYFRTNFGAGVTALPDSSALVYSVMPNHPLNLQPGDIILGYDGIPWLQCLDDLFEQELPALLSGSAFAASTEARIHNSVTCAGNNWGLFDTIDVVKYGTNDIQHFPTSLLQSISQPYFIATEQMPVNGVPFPDLSANILVSWGVVQGTNIGYIYAWDWDAGSGSQSEILFAQAVDELMHINKVDGLILDFRTNIGGWPGHANDGLKYLFNIDPTSNYSRAIRVPGNDHFLFNIMSPDPLEPFTPNSELFDHPIAVLTGPRCQSAGDYNAFRMRFHPMTRSFGKKTACAYTDYNANNIFNYSYYRYRVDNGCLYSNYNNEEYMIHKGFPVDEEVWLTRDGVANGQDDVVNRAIEWINNLVYPHDILSDDTYYSPVEDIVQISTIIENPNSRQISARGYISNLNDVLIDSVDLVQQTFSSDGENWTGSLYSPSTEDYFKISVTVFDQTTADEFTLPNATRFSTVGPITLDSLYVVDHTTYFTVKPFVRNHSITQTINEASIKLICNDPWVTSISPNSLNLPSILPGAIVSTTNSFNVNIDTSIFLSYFNFRVEVSNNIWHYWTDSMRVPQIVPVELTSFTAVANGKDVTLNWSTATETNNRGFQIERSQKSETGIQNAPAGEEDWKNIGFIQGNGTATEEHSYSFVDKNISVGTYKYRLKQIDFDGSYRYSQEVGIEVAAPLVFSLEQNYPNPFNPSTKIKYSVPQKSQVQIKVFGVLGNEIETLVNEEKPAGTYELTWNAANLPSGVYFYRIKAGDFIQTKKMLLLK